MANATKGITICFTRTVRYIFKSRNILLKSIVARRIPIISIESGVAIFPVVVIAEVISG